MAQNNGVPTHVGYIHQLSQYSGYTQQNISTRFPQRTGFMAQSDGGTQLHYGSSQHQQHQHGIYPQDNGCSTSNDGFSSQLNSGYYCTISDIVKVTIHSTMQGVLSKLWEFQFK